MIGNEYFFQDTDTIGDDVAPHPSGGIDGYRKRKHEMDHVDPDDVRDPAIPSNIPLVIEVPHVSLSSVNLLLFVLSPSALFSFVVLLVFLCQASVELKRRHNMLEKSKPVVL